MSVVLIDGKALALALREEIAERVLALQCDRGLQPGLAVVRVGEDLASEGYLLNKEQRTRDAGILSTGCRSTLQSTSCATVSSPRVGSAG